jgi:hypothetical protein
MKQQNKSSKSTIIVIIIIVAAVIGYFYYEGSIPAVNTGLTQIDAMSGDDIMVTQLLAQVDTIRIDTKLFTDMAFKSLKDYTVSIQPLGVGRQNPFAPVPGMVVTKPKQ